jgi:SH3-like domain-containing protein
MRVTAATLLLLTTVACSKGQPGTPPAPGAPAPGATGPSAEAAQSSYVLAVATLRKTPDAADKILGPDGKAKVTNYLPSTLQRGERVTVLEAKEDWVRVRTSDDKEGWLRATIVLDGTGVTEATLLAQADVFDRPDLLAANAKRKLEPGSLLLVVKAKPPFSEVNVPGAGNAWVLTERLAAGEREVGVAKLIEKARFLVKNNRKEEAQQILSLAKSQFSDVVLVQQLELELNPPPPPEGTPPAEPPAQ